MQNASLALLRAATPLLRRLRAALRSAGPDTPSSPGAYGVLAQDQYRRS